MTAPTLRTGQRVRYVGLFGDGTDGPTGRVSRVCRGYVKVRFDDGRLEDLHPEGLRPI
ncbi:hypothetical protein MTY66_50760 [Mycolicibacterium sp. TY66]|uniref:hypothetical protein n=1 Tax=unclassified Mycolicibacterium TaxID=2636767 RepID=UPI001BB30596|nr:MULTISPECIES: hypothetical protein [unclassified Mycolicibacterium]BCI83451.1 hypothetical protein MTY66_50760 [Mycolicibacterium sp. TY66]BCJ78905.1 hypothetical protein MTY81_02780 [Mycolicibacterium sp. TY81]